MFTHTPTWINMNEAKLSQKGNFWGEHYSIIEKKCEAKFS